MTSTRAPIPASERKRLTLDAITAVESIDSGEWTARESLDLAGPELVDGLVLLVNLYEAMIHLSRGVDIPLIRQAARDTAEAAR